MSLLISRYGSVCRLIAGLFPNQLEVVLHDAKTGKIAAIEGVYSNRKIGDTSLIDVDTLDKDANEEDLIGPYPQTNWDGEQLKSFTAILRSDEENASKEILGFLCVNCRTSAFSAAAELLSAFSGTGNQTQPKALFKNDWRDSVNQLIRKTLAKRQVTLVNATRSDKVEIARALDKSGLLEFRGSPEFVTQSLGVSRASFYNLLKDSRLAKAVDEPN